MINLDRKRLRSHFFFDERVYLLCLLRDNLLAFKITAARLWLQLLLTNPPHMNDTGNFYDQLLHGYKKYDDEDHP